MLFILIVILALVIAVVLVLLLVKKENLEPDKTVPDDCCGAHAVCERDRLLSSTDEIIYFDDEELDALAGKDPYTFTEEEYDMVEEVLFSLRESDVAGWLRSLQLRNIEIPNELKDEALLIVSERRSGNHTNDAVKK
ncbi:MAG: phospholipase [Bacteroidales bacterium]|nr:phospholipase [Bacteroidales bacterium]